MNIVKFEEKVIEISVSKTKEETSEEGKGE